MSFVRSGGKIMLRGKINFLSCKEMHLTLRIPMTSWSQGKSIDSQFRWKWIWKTSNRLLNLQFNEGRLTAGMLSPSPSAWKITSIATCPRRETRRSYSIWFLTQCPDTWMPLPLLSPWQMLYSPPMSRWLREKETCWGKMRKVSEALLNPSNPSSLSYSGH